MKKRLLFFVLTLVAAFTSTKAFADDVTFEYSTNYGTYSTYYLSNAFDGNDETKFWSDGPQSYNKYILITFSSLVNLNYFGTYTPASGDAPRSNNALQVSEDGENWTEVGRFIDDETDQSFDLASDYSGHKIQYVRIYADESPAVGNWLQINEIDMNYEVWKDESVSYNITLAANDASRGTVAFEDGSASATVNGGVHLTATATPNANYRFVKWVDADGELVSLENPYSFVAAKDLALTAVFNKDAQYEITYNYVLNGVTVDSRTQTVNDGDVVPAPETVWGYLNDAYTHEGEVAESALTVDVTVSCGFVISAETGSVSAMSWTSNEDNPFKVTFGNGIDCVRGNELLLHSKSSEDMYSCTHTITVDPGAMVDAPAYYITGYTIYFHASDPNDICTVVTPDEEVTNSSDIREEFIASASNLYDTEVSFTVTNTVGEYKKILVSKIVVTYEVDGSVGIKNAEVSTDNTIFNLAGQRVNRADKGVYVVNGKKVIF